MFKKSLSGFKRKWKGFTGKTASVAAVVCFFSPLMYSFSSARICFSQPSIYPAVFDAFDYLSGPSATAFDVGRFTRGESYSGSIFGVNVWYTDEGMISSRAWRRYNWDDLDFNCTNCGVEGIEGGGIELFVGRGGRAGGDLHGRLPGIASGFITSTGTYAARVRVLRPPAVGNFIQAFWTGGQDQYMIDNGDYWIGYQSETDIEVFSPQYKRDRTPDISVANYLGKRYRKRGDSFDMLQTISASAGLAVGDLTCVVYGGTHRAREVDCLEILFDRDWIMRMWLHDEYVEYSIVAADGSQYEIGVTEEGNLVNAGVRPIQIQRFPPAGGVKTIFGLYSDDTTHVPTSRLSMRVHWYYHSPAFLSTDQVGEQVDYWRSLYPRVNTLGADFRDVGSGSSFSLEILGPERVPRQGGNTWSLALTPLGTTYIFHRYEYILHLCANGSITRSSPPIRITSLNLTDDEIPTYDALTIRVDVMNRWSGQRRTQDMVVLREGASCGI